MKIQQIAKKLNNIKVSQVMQKKIKSVKPTDSLEKVAKMLRKKDTYILPVVSKGKFLGEVDERDFIKLFLGQKRMRFVGLFGVDKHLFAKNVGDLMRRHTGSLDPDMNLEEAVYLLLNKGVMGMPVAKGQKLVGFITVEDIIKKIENLSMK